MSVGTDEHPFTPSPSPLPPSLPSHHRRFDGCTQDTKPHRQIPLSLIIDALEYDLPPHRNHPTATSPPPASPQAALLVATAAAAAPDDGDGAGTRTHTFKVVTTKRTLLLCAPSEEEEIRWLSAIRALIARRSGQGVVPGEPQSVGVSSPAGAAAAVGAGGAAGAAGAAGTTAPGSPSPIHKRRDSIVRRLSLSGGGSPFIGGGSAPSAGVSSSTSTSTVTAVPPGVQREGSSERQS